MASISVEPNGRRVIQFVALDNRRKTIRLGKVSQRVAERVQGRVEQLLAAKLTGHRVEADTARWVAKLPDALADRLARVRLIPRRERAAGTTLGAFVDAFIASRPDVKQATPRIWKQTRRLLVDFFGVDRDMASVTSFDARAFHAKLAADGFAVASVSKYTSFARQFFGAAVGAGRL
jgi:hypothetical protein